MEKIGSIKAEIETATNVQFMLSYVWKDPVELGNVEKLITRVIKYKESFHKCQRVDNGSDGPSVWAQKSCFHLPEITSPKEIK